MLGLRSKKETEFVLYYAEKLELKSHFTLNWKSKTPKKHSFISAKSMILDVDRML